MNKYWFFSWILGWTELANSLCRILTLGFYNPSFDFKYIFWISKRRITREINKRKIAPPFPGYKILTLLLPIIITLVIVQPAGAWEPGGCVKDKSICYGPTISAPGIIFDFNGRLEVDALVGAGYEVRFMADRFYSVGAAVLADFDRSETGSSRARVSLAASLFRVLRVGMGIELREGQKPRGFGIFSLGMYFENPI